MSVLSPSFASPTSFPRPLLSFLLTAQAIPNVWLDNGVMMPVVAQGVVTHEEMGAGQIQTMVEQAVAAGHRRFDSAPGEREVELGG